MATILVIDDDDFARETLRDLLQQAGYQVVEARDGREGVRCYRAAPADLVITDLFMPEQEGLETIQMLRREFPTIKLIAVSGGGQAGTTDLLQIAKKFGAQYVFSKPYDWQKLSQALQDLLHI